MVGLGRRLVRPDPADPGEAHGEPRAVALAEVDGIERHLHHQRLLHLAHRTEPGHRVIAYPPVQPGQFLIGEPEIRLADRHQLVAAPQAERIVGVVAAALAVATLATAIGQIGGRGAIRALERLSEDAGEADLELIESTIEDVNSMLDPFTSS